MEIQIDTASDQAILSALREGKLRHAAGLMVRYYGNAIFTVCRNRLVQPEAAEDLTQECFRRAFSELAGLQGASSPLDWLLRIAESCCADRPGPEASAAGTSEANSPLIAEPPEEASRATCGGLIPERPEAARTRNSPFIAEPPKEASRATLPFTAERPQEASRATCRISESLQRRLEMLASAL